MGWEREGEGTGGEGRKGKGGSERKVRRRGYGKAHTGTFFFTSSHGKESNLTSNKAKQLDRFIPCDLRNQTMPPTPRQGSVLRTYCSGGHGPADGASWPIRVRDQVD